MNIERLKRIEAEHLSHIRGKIADAIRERIERMSKATKNLNDHLSECRECQVLQTPWKLCPKGNLLFKTILEA